MSRWVHVSLFGFVVIAAGTLGFLSYKVAAPIASEGSASSAELRPSFSLPDLQGTTRNTSEWDGRWLLVNFWATWCPPCVKELPLLNAIEKEYQGKGLHIVGIAIDRRSAVENFVQTTPIDFPVLLAENNGTVLARDYGNLLGGLPFSVVVDPTGRIVYRWSGELEAEDIRNQLDQFLGG